MALSGQRKIEYQREYQKRNRSALSEQKKERRQQQREYIWQEKDKPCCDCGIKYPPWVMDFDHVRGDKKYEITRLMKISVSWQTIKDELAKCDVVCSNCHRDRTYKRANALANG